MAGKLTQDEIRWVLSLDAKGVQSELVNISSKAQDLTQKNKELGSELKLVEKDLDSLQKQMAKLAASGDTSSQKYERLKKTFLETSKDVDTLRSQIESNNRSIDNYIAKSDKLIETLRIEDMTMDQLKRRSEELEKQLFKTSQSTDTAAYDALQGKLNEVRERMGELKKGSNDTDNVFAQFTDTVNKYWASILAGYKLVEGAFSTWKDIMMSNRATSVEFESTMNGLNEALDYTKTALANLDFTNFIEGLTRAYDAGKEVTKILDELFDRQNSFDLTAAPIKAEIEDLKTQLRDVNLSNEKRINIANRIIGLTNGLAEQQRDIIMQEIDANEKRLDGQLAMTKAEKEYVIVNYNKNIESIRLVKKIIELEQQRNHEWDLGLKTMSESQIESNYYLKTERNLINQIDLLKKSADFSEIAYSGMQKYLLGSQDLVKGYVSAQKKLLDVDIQTNRELRRTETMKSTITKSGKKSGETAEQKQRQKEQKELSKINEDLEIAHKEKLTKINLEYLNGEIKTEADFNRKSFAQEQAYYILREKSLKDFIDRAKNEEIKRDASKQLATVQEKMLSQQVKYQKQLEKIILNADPVKKEKQAYDERLDALGIYGETAQSLQEKIATAQTEDEKQQLQQKYDAFLLLEKQYQDNQDKIKKAGKAKERADAEAVFQESFKQRKEEMQQELNDLANQAATLSGNASFEADMAVHVQKLRMIQEELTARREARAETAKQVAEIGKIEAQMTATLQKENAKRISTYNKYATTLGTATGEVLSGQKSAFEAFGGSMIDMLFDILSQIINTKIVEATAVAVAEQAKAAAIAAALPDSVITFGASAAARTAAIGAIIMGALQVAKTALKGMVGKKKGSSSSTSDSGKSSGAITVKQKGYAEGGQHLIGGYTGDGGKYDVKGVFPDGEPYHAGEYMIPKEEMKLPWIQEMVRNIDATRLKRTKKNPLPAGFAEGGSHGIDPDDMMALGTNTGLMARFIEVMERLDKKEFKTYWGLTEYQSKLEEMNKEDNRFKRKQ